MLHRIHVDVLHMLIVFTLIPNRVLVESFLPDSTNISAFPALGRFTFRSTVAKVGMREATFDQSDTRGVVLVVVRDPTKEMEVVLQ